MAPLRWSGKRRGLTLLQLLVLLAVLVLLFGFLLGLVVRARQMAEQAQSQNNLKQIGLATINCADTYAGKLPPGPDNWFPAPKKAGNNGHGPCLFHIAPYLEQDNLYKASLTQVGDTMIYASWKVAGKTIPTYVSKKDPTADPQADRTSYLANELALPRTSARYPISFTDGTSNTILFAEAYSQATDTFTLAGKEHIWTTDRRWWDNAAWVPTPGALLFQIAPPKASASLALPQGHTAAGMNVGLADASVHVVAGRTSATTFYHACTPAGGEILGNDW